MARTHEMTPRPDLAHDPQYTRELAWFLRGYFFVNEPVEWSEKVAHATAVDISGGKSIEPKAVLRMKLFALELIDKQ